MGQSCYVCVEYPNFLGVDVICGRSVSEIGEDLQSCRTEDEVQYKHYTAVRVNKGQARDAEFILLYVILMDELQDRVQVRQQIYGPVLFVHSHRAILKRNTHSVLWIACTERFEISAKQQGQLESQRNKHQRSNVEDDVTTEVEDGDKIDSDSSAW